MKSMIVPERLFISTERAQEIMDNFAKIMVTAYEVWRREKLKSGASLTGDPESVMRLFIKDISN
jgi:hypothetical protein